MNMEREYIVKIGFIGDAPGNKELVRCKDCKHAVLTTNGEVKYCKCWQGDEDGSYGGDPLYLDGDFYCAAGERKDADG